MSEKEEKITGLDFGITIAYTFLVIFFTWLVTYGIVTRNPHQLSEYDENKRFEKALRAISEIDNRSPTKIVQIFPKETAEGTAFLCICEDEEGDRETYTTTPNHFRIPKVGEWWELGLDWQGDWELEYPDTQKNRLEAEVVDGGEA